MAERPEDLNLPASIVTKIIKDCLPPGCKVSKEANAAITKAASVFVLYATSSASSVAQKSNRKTISGPDVIKAMTEMEFDKFVRPLENSLSMWKKTQQDKKETAAKKKASKEKPTAGEKDPEVVEVADAEPDKEKENQEEEEEDEVQEVEPTDS